MNKEVSQVASSSGSPTATRNNEPAETKEQSAGFATFPAGRVTSLNIEANKALCKLADALKGTPDYYEINKLIRRLWDLNLPEKSSNKKLSHAAESERGKQK